MQISQEMIDDYNSGTSVRQLCQKYGISKHFVERDLEMLGIYRKRVVIGKEVECKMVEDYKNGDSALQIGARYGFADTSVFRTLKKYGIETRPLKIAKRKSPIDEHFFDVIDCEEKAYIFGLLFADGCKRDHENCIAIGLQERDYEILNYINAMIQPGSTVRYLDKSKSKDTCNRKNQYRIEIWNDIIATTLESYGMVPRKSLIKTFPNVIADASEDIIRHFIRGYFDGNGSITMSHTGVDVRHATFGISSTYEMCESIDEILTRFVGKKSCKIVRRHEVNNFMLICSKINDILNIMSWLYKDAAIFLPRKHFKYQVLEYRKGRNL